MSVISTGHIPRKLTKRGRYACDHRSPQWREYQQALMAKGRAHQERTRQQHIRSAVAQAAAVVIADCEDYLRDLRSNIDVVQ